MLLLLLLVAAPAGDVLETRLEATLAGEGSLEATVHYRFVLHEELRRVPLALLEVNGTRVHSIEAAEGERTLAATLAASESPRRRGYVELAEPHLGDVSLQIRYTVSAAVAREGDGLRVRFPVAVLDLPQGEARAEAFSATLELPRGLVPIESFPSGFARSGNTYVGVLPLVPAFVYVRAAPAGTIVTFERAVDWGVLALVAALGAVGLRQGLRALG